MREIRFAEGARAIVNAPMPGRFDDQKPTQLVIFATPNGNTAEQTLGCEAVEGLDWHFNIQHVTAQIRTLREISPERNIVLACVQPDNRSWPTWSRKHAAAAQTIDRITRSLRALCPGDTVSVTLTGHSGGGGFIFGAIDANEAISQHVDRIAPLDANYYYSNEKLHGEKLLEWLSDGKQRQLVVLAYDDRNIELNGKKVVGPTGGTFRASHRFLDFLQGRFDQIAHDQLGELDRYSVVEGRLLVVIHPNPENKILHTRLVGEMNGLLYALTVGTEGEYAWSDLRHGRAYTEWVQPQPYDPAKWSCGSPALPARRAKAEGGTAFVQRLLQAGQREMEEAAVDEVLSGNVPRFLGDFVEIRSSATGDDGQPHEIVYYAMPDYLSVGSDEDYVRVPLTPYTAQHLADMLGCVLPTRKMVDDIYRQAPVKLAPRPLTEAREALATFLQHNQIIEGQLPDGAAGKLVGGIKKDVVVSNLLAERPHRVAIYGWHRTDGAPIQPLTTVHVDHYVDYSHAVRLIAQWATVDGRPMRIENVLRDPQLCSLLSDEGPVPQSKYVKPEPAM